MRILTAVLLSLTLGASAHAQHQAITATGIDKVRLCDPLARVDSIFSQVHDTVIFGEDGTTRWAAKVVSRRVGYVLFESSWADTVRIWRISTTSPQYRTKRGYHVGSVLADLRRDGESFTVHYPEGRVVLSLKRDSVSALVDDSAEAILRGADASKFFSANGRMTELIVAGACR